MSEIEIEEKYFSLRPTPEVLGQPRGAQFGPKCHWLVQLDGLHPYHVLRPLKRPLQHSWGPQKGPLWPIKPLLVAPEALGQPQGA